MQLYLWKYGQWGDEPTIVLRTRRSLRAVHFHPNGAPLLLTAEVSATTVSPRSRSLKRREGVKSIGGTRIAVVA